MSSQLNYSLEKFFNNSGINGAFPSLDSVYLDESQRKSENGEQIKFCLYNYTDGPIEIRWVNYEGEEQASGDKINPNCHQMCLTGVNHCYRLYFSNGDSFYYRVPNNTFGYVGDFENLKNNITNSCWHGHESHLEACNLLNKDEFPDKPELTLVCSYPFDQSNISSFLSKFNKQNKFADPFFNPLNKIDANKYKLVRVGDMKVKKEVALNGYESKDLKSQFKFLLTNNLNESFIIYWIDFGGKFKNYGTLNHNGSINMTSGLGNSWAIKNASKCLFFRLGEAPFLHTGCNVQISSITRSIDVNIDIESEQATLIDTCIYDKGVFHEDSARQGCIGDCYLLQCLSSISSRYPGAITSKFLNPDSFKETGVVLIKLYSSSFNSWRLVLMDDFLPIDQNEGYFGVSPSGPLNNEYWSSFLEKAFAKYKTAFPLLQADVGYGIEDIYRMILGPIECDIFSLPNHQDDELFEKFLNYYRKGAVISFSSRTSDQAISTKTGMVNYHGYGLMDVRENVCGSGLTLVKCHNVWSQGGEWIGDWSDESPLWDKHPNIKAELKFIKKNDGAFWIEKKDFHKAFQVIWVAILSNEALRLEKEASNLRRSMLTTVDI